MRNVFIALPHYGEIHPSALPGLILATMKDDVRISLVANPSSLLAHNFNCQWAEAYTRRKAEGLTHFAMHHSDIQAEPGWIDKLLKEKDRTGADVISTIVPIKDRRGLSSTGLIDPAERKVVKRFTMREIHCLPESFTAAEIGYKDQWLAVNTGLWIADLDDRWKDFPGFEIRSRLNWEDDTPNPAVLPEDWNFSAWCGEKGLKVVATRLVGIEHWGSTPYTNREPWGTWRRDLSDFAGQAEGINGWAYKEELDWLRERSWPAKVVVEVGCWWGRTTHAIAEACHGKVYAVDHFQGSPHDTSSEELRNVVADGTGAEARTQFHKNMKVFLETEKVELLEMDSLAAATELKDRGVRPNFVFLDGSHDYYSVRNDITRYRSLLEPGGILSGHDRHLQSVRKAVDELCPGWIPGPGRIWECRI